jgi:hypothetical protein
MRASGHENYAEFDWLVFQWSFLICISLPPFCRMHFMSTWLALGTGGLIHVLFATWRDEDR